MTVGQRDRCHHFGVRQVRSQAGTWVKDMWKPMAMELPKLQTSERCAGPGPWLVHGSNLLIRGAERGTSIPNWPLGGTRVWDRSRKIKQTLDTEGR